MTNIDQDCEAEYSIGKIRATVLGELNDKLVEINDYNESVVRRAFSAICSVFGTDVFYPPVLVASNECKEAHYKPSETAIIMNAVMNRLPIVCGYIVRIFALDNRPAKLVLTPYACNETRDGSLVHCTPGFQTPVLFVKENNTKPVSENVTVVLKTWLLLCVTQQEYQLNISRATSTEFLKRVDIMKRLFYDVDGMHITLPSTLEVTEESLEMFMGRGADLQMGKTLMFYCGPAVPFIPGQACLDNRLEKIGMTDTSHRADLTDSYCWYCHKFLQTVYYCSECMRAIYCSEQCRLNDAKAGHDMLVTWKSGNGLTECEIYRKLS